METWGVIRPGDLVRRSGTSIYSRVVSTGPGWITLRLLEGRESCQFSPDNFELIERHTQ